MKYPLFLAMILSAFTACEEGSVSRNQMDTSLIYDFDKTPQQQAVEAIDEILFVADYQVADNQKTMVLSKVADDTLIVKGAEVNGIGAVISERHQTVKGYPVITKSVSYGLPSGATYVRTDKYVSYSDFANDIPADTRETEVIGMDDGSIKTFLIHNEQQITYTFRSPIETINGNKTTLRYGLASGRIATETSQNSTLLSTRYTFGLATGATVALTEYPDDSWTQTETLGLLDGTIRKTVSSGTN